MPDEFITNPNDLTDELKNQADASSQNIQSAQNVSMPVYATQPEQQVLEVAEEMPQNQTEQPVINLERHDQNATLEQSTEQPVITRSVLPDSNHSYQEEVPPLISNDLLEMSLMREEDNIDIISILTLAVQREASDVYLKSETPAMARILGKLAILTDFKLTAFGVEKLAKSLMNEKQNVKFAENLSLDMSFAAKGIGRFRVSVYRQRGTVAMVLRRIKTQIPTIEELHLPAVLKTISMQKRGLVLVTGSTGSGKTSTLSAMLDYRNLNSSGHIITVEDPIEFMLSDKKSIISQREIDIDTLSWERALIDAMREAPDVVLIGELRDLFAAKTALNLAETGHLVLTTLHSSDTLQTLERLIAMFPQEQHPELYLRLSLSLVGIVCQRLLLTKDMKSRYPAVEIMFSSPRIRDLIRKGEIQTIKETISISRNDGMQTFDQHLLELWKQNIVTEDEALLHSDSPNNLRLLMKGITYAGVE